MIKTKTKTFMSNTGLPVLCYDGCFLSSKVDPIRTAQAWVESQKQMIGPNKSLIVLGLGSGYHVVALKHTYPQKRVIVIESCKEIINFCNQYLVIDLAGVEILHYNNIRDFKMDSKIVSFLQHSYSVLSFQPSLFIGAELYGDIEGLLLGRRSQDFDFLLEHKKNLNLNNKKFKKALNKELQNKDELIEIKKIKKVVEKYPEIVSDKFNQRINLLSQLVV